MIRKRVINLSHKIEGSLFTRNSHIISISGEGIIFYNGGIKKYSLMWLFLFHLMY